MREAIARGDRIMGFGHRVYRAYDPRAAALRKVAEGMADMADWLALAVKVEDVVLRILGELKPDRVTQDQRRVLRGGRAAGRRAPARPLPAHLRPGPAGRLDRPRHRAGGHKPPHPAGRPLHGARGAAPAAA